MCDGLDFFPTGGGGVAIALVDMQTYHTAATSSAPIPATGKLSGQQREQLLMHVRHTLDRALDHLSDLEKQHAALHTAHAEGLRANSVGAILSRIDAAAKAHTLGEASYVELKDALRMAHGLLERGKSGGVKASKINRMVERYESAVARFQGCKAARATWKDRRDALSLHLKHMPPPVQIAEEIAALERAARTWAAQIAAETQRVVELGRRAASQSLHTLLADRESVHTSLEGPSTGGELQGRALSSAKYVESQAGKQGMELMRGWLRGFDQILDHAAAQQQALSQIRQAAHGQILAAIEAAGHATPYGADQIRLAEVRLSLETYASELREVIAQAHSLAQADFTDDRSIDQVLESKPYLDSHMAALMGKLQDAGAKLGQITDVAAPLAVSVQGCAHAWDDVQQLATQAADVLAQLSIERVREKWKAGVKQHVQALNKVTVPPPALLDEIRKQLPGAGRFTFKRSSKAKKAEGHLSALQSIEDIQKSVGQSERLLHQVASSLERLQRQGAKHFNKGVVDAVSDALGRAHQKADVLQAVLEEAGTLRGEALRRLQKVSPSKAIQRQLRQLQQLHTELESEAHHVPAMALRIDRSQDRDQLELVLIGWQNTATNARRRLQLAYSLVTGIDLASEQMDERKKAKLDGYASRQDTLQLAQQRVMQIDTLVRLIQQRLQTLTLAQKLAPLPLTTLLGAWEGRTAQLSEAVAGAEARVAETTSVSRLQAAGNRTVYSDCYRAEADLNTANGRLTVLEDEIRVKTATPDPQHQHRLTALQGELDGLHARIDTAMSRLRRFGEQVEAVDPAAVHLRELISARSLCQSTLNRLERAPPAQQELIASEGRPDTTRLWRMVQLHQDDRDFLQPWQDVDRLCRAIDARIAAL